MDIQLKNIPISGFDYPLPPERIAHFPLGKRDQSKLLVYQDGRISDDRFDQLPAHLEDALLVLNNTRVIEARILFQKPTGGHIEIFCLQPHEQTVEEALQQQGSCRWLCLIGGASKWKPGQVLKKKVTLQGQEVILYAAYELKTADAFVIRFSWEPSSYSFSQLLHAAGQMPLPPYIKRSVEVTDQDRYQTVFGKKEGSVAAPTAALHFLPETFQALEQKNVEASFITLHVGAGTFKPVKTATIGEHEMHGEPFSVQLSTLRKLVQAKQVIAVGTTSLRTLECLYWFGIKLRLGDSSWNLDQWEAYDLEEKFPAIPYRESLQGILEWMEKENLQTLHGFTSLMIVPGYVFRIPAALITNFHQPQSTLLLLVSAFIGEDWKKVYDHALQNDYRFLSYGDSSLLWRSK